MILTKLTATIREFYHRLIECAEDSDRMDYLESLKHKEVMFWQPNGNDQCSFVPDCNITTSIREGNTLREAIDRARVEVKP